MCFIFIFIDGPHEVVRKVQTTSIPVFQEPPLRYAFSAWEVFASISRLLRSRLNFYEIQDLPLFLRRFWALKRECSELHDR